MAKYVTEISEDFYSLVQRIEEGILNGSMSATLEDCSDFEEGDSRCSVRVFERFSYVGNNRVSLSITLFQTDHNMIHVSAITSGGSQAIFNKINTIGEENFLDKLKEII